MNIEEQNKLIEKESDNKYDKESKKQTYPIGVLDNESYDNYLIFSKQWKEHIQRFYTVKSKNIKLDLAQSPDKIDNLIKDLNLTKGEISIIKKINSNIYYLVQKSTLYKQKAFGRNSVNLTENGFSVDDVSGCTPIIIELAGRFYKAEQIYQVLCEDMEITTVSIGSIKTIIKNNISKIKQLQEEFKKDYSDIRLGYKKSRMMELEELYNNRKIIYNKNRNREDEKELLTLLDSIKKEVQGDLVINADVNLSIENKANEYIQKEMLKTLNVSMYILANIAGKLNINPLMILSRLSHSRYAQFSGFSENGLSPTSLTDPISYASNITYNWNKIKEQNTEIIEEENIEAKLPLIEENNKKHILSLKEKLKEKLNDAKKPLNNGKDSIKINKEQI